MKKPIGVIREIVLREYISYTPNGAEKLANAAISCLPYSQLKKLVEALELEREVEKAKKQ